jgi:glycosyltransferase involved in cell wall biosynthesis
MASGHITYSYYYATELANMGYDMNMIFCAQNTIDVEKISDNQKFIIKSESSSIVKFLFVGALIPPKNLDKIIYVCKKLKDEQFKFVFDIVGDGIIRNELSKMIQGMDLQDVVFLHGSKYGEEVAVFFQRADVFVLPGTGGLAINEAMAYSLPIIATPGDGTGYDLVKNNENGFLLKFDYELNELYRCMKYFLSCDRQMLREMGERSHELVMQKASLHNMVNKFLQAIISTIGTSRNA